MDGLLLDDCISVEEFTKLLADADYKSFAYVSVDVTGIATQTLIVDDETFLEETLVSETTYAKLKEVVKQYALGRDVDPYFIQPGILFKLASNLKDPDLVYKRLDQKYVHTFVKKNLHGDSKVMRSLLRSNYVDPTKITISGIPLVKYLRYSYRHYKLLESVYFNTNTPIEQCLDTLKSLHVSDGTCKYLKQIALKRPHIVWYSPEIVNDLFSYLPAHIFEASFRSNFVIGKTGYGYPLFKEHFFSIYLLIREWKDVPSDIVGVVMRTLIF